MSPSPLQDAVPTELLVEIVHRLVLCYTQNDARPIPQLMNLGKTCRRMSNILKPFIFEQLFDCLVAMQVGRVLQLHQGDSSVILGRSQGYWGFEQLLGCESGFKISYTPKHQSLYNAEEPWALYHLLRRLKAITQFTVFIPSPGATSEPGLNVGSAWNRGLASSILATAQHPGSILKFEGDPMTFRYVLSPFKHEIHVTSIQPSVAPSTPTSARLPTHDKKPSQAHRISLLLRRVFNGMREDVGNSKGEVDQPMATPQPPSNGQTDNHIISTLKYPPPGMNFPSCTTSFLAEIELGTPRMLDPWWYHITQSLLQSSYSTLTRLSFSAQHLCLYDWRHILPTWSFPQLKIFAPRRTEFANPDLHDFLLRHPSISTLDLTGNELAGSVDISSFANTDFLPNLEMLIATPDYLIPFLAPTTASLFPKLARVKVTQEMRRTFSCFVANDYNRLMELLASRTPTAGVEPITDLAFEFDSNQRDAYFEWFTSVSSRRALPFVRQLSVYARRWWQEMEEGLAMMEEGFAILASWLRMFPGLSELVVGKGMFDEPNMQEWAQDNPAGPRILWDACPQLRSISMQPIDYEFTRPDLG
ncbi:hypothetical protein CC1G_07541 [Coprinopsis cinerea okayama7|uniref:Uncharacterized protein n=1 Tax=Coprinopsis cinerea (strain Okayama-7 / 130 / ATCC MYA-4618 / FGSC 9003) TaxID=240176 RepID=A8P191_COPC7|nr:hypothetical protein CC1G_07541 [Coprinopsis cinerea okayama7\|eukprot:XP_001838051.1 hypothetical protein CC1G_07541 [Coprinopsis cinerea okayama7\